MTAFFIGLKASHHEQIVATQSGQNKTQFTISTALKPCQTRL